MLRTMDVEFGQGFLLHRPEPLGALLARQRQSVSAWPQRMAMSG